MSDWDPLAAEVLVAAEVSAVEEQAIAETFRTVAQHIGDIPAGTLRAIERDLEVAFGKGWLR